MRQAGRQINCNYNKQSQWKAFRNENHVLRLCRRLPPCFPSFSTFPLCDFSILEFFFFFIAAAVAVAVAAQGRQGFVSIALLNMFTAISCMKYMSFCADLAPNVGPLGVPRRAPSILAINWRMQSGNASKTK